MDRLQLPALRRGDAIGVFALSSPFEEHFFQAGLERLRGLGFEIRLASNIHERRGYLAGKDRQRAAGFNELARDRRVRALIAARGGYGSMRTLELLDLAALRDDPKPVLGCSDVTALHLWLIRKLGLNCGHTPMVASRQMAELDGQAEQRLRALLCGAVPEPLNPAGTRVLRSGSGEGALLGGNLTMLVHALAGNVVPAGLFDSAVLLLEDTNEKAYRVDRMFATLKLAGIFERIAGLVLGDFMGEVRAEQVDELALWALEERKVPVLAGFPLGHGASNLALPLGTKVRLSGRGLEFVEPLTQV